MKFFHQYEVKDCGPTCLKMILHHYGVNTHINNLLRECQTTLQGTSIKNLIKGAESFCLQGIPYKLDINDLDEFDQPIIAHVNDTHYVVIIKKTKDSIYIADPAIGKFKIKCAEFESIWYKEDSKKGYAIMFDRMEGFYDLKLKSTKTEPFYVSVLKFLKKYRRLNFQLFLGILVISFLQMLFPFLTQFIVDYGIKNKSIHLTLIICFGTFVIFISKVISEFIQAKLLLFVGARFSISLVSDFIMELMNLPISYFDSKNTGSILQRVFDHKKIENFVMEELIELVFSVLTFFALGIVLLIYNIQIFLVFILGSMLYLAWILYFLKKRKYINYLQFSVVAEETSKLNEIVNGMQELKLYNAENQRKYSWEKIKIKLYDNSIKAFNLNQIQSVGSRIINETKNLVIIATSAFLVINGEMTLGMMLAICSITAQLDLPVLNFAHFIYSYQDAKISYDRISTIYDLNKHRKNSDDTYFEIDDIELSNVSFTYLGDSKSSLKNISTVIEKGKKTAIVGKSGSGKTTLVKLLLKYYEYESGTIRVGVSNFVDINEKSWRNKCGAVMQEGFIFNDTVLKNITLKEDKEEINLKRVVEVAKIANIYDEIQRMPLQFETMIGIEGRGMSKGQHQRIMIARALYKDPDILFFDEATSSLDAMNESIITRNLSTALVGKTTITVAHRLSTVIQADKILVMDNGEILEQGTHSELLKLKSHYYMLIKNQLELN